MPFSRRRLLHLAAAGGGILLSRSLWPPARADTWRAGVDAQPALRLGLISDLNSGYGSTSYVPQVGRGVELLLRQQPELVLCAGDMVAGQKLGLSAGQLDAMWAAFGEQVLDPLLARGIAFAPAMGNHDASSSRSQGRYVFGLDRERAARFWAARRSSLGLQLLDAEAFPFRYSLLQQGVFVLVLDASSASVGADQRRWADEQLSSAAARQARARLVIGHLPLFGVSQGRDRPGEVVHQGASLQQLMERHGVTLYVSGHHHAYFPSRVGQLNLLSLGAMGSGPRRLLQGGQPPGQTLTMLELQGDSGRISDTTYSLDTLKPIDPRNLPGALQPSTGPTLTRRSGVITLG